MFLNCHYFSKVMMTNVEINVVLPTPEGNEQITDKGKDSRYDYEGGLPVIYLLHGAYGDANSWMRFSCVERYCQEHGVVGVMAGVTNSFYQDTQYGANFYTYMTEELPEYITTLFPVSKDREKTFIAGFSMGGYGALYLALSKPELYSKAASMSGAVDIVALRKAAMAGQVDSPFEWKYLFEDPDALEGTDKDLFELLKRDKEKGCVPKLYQSCGTNDFLFEVNRDAHKKFVEMGADITYKEVEGCDHNWDFWDKDIRCILDWACKS